ncbi:MAG: ferredoxin--NADP reductase [Xanthomonadales bacterium]|nr:ferredoxin--NADP reductase [Xanthomonadales bacterium]
MTDTETVLSVHHWNDSYFSLTTTRDAGLRFRNGQFVMLGLMIGGRLVRRAYSIASANWDEALEFYSIKVPGGVFSSALAQVQPGDPIHVSRKPVGTLVLDDLRPGRCLWLLSTGTGLAPFLAVLRDPETWERFAQVHLVHGVRRVGDLAYRELLEQTLAEHEYLGPLLRGRLHYVPVVSREPFPRAGRITSLLADGRLAASIPAAPLDPAHDRLMLCGGPGMLTDLRALLDARGFVASPSQGVPGDYVYERAFVER